MLCCQCLTAQFYNGYQQDFGKNRVQFDEKFWFFFRHEKFDIYFDKNGHNLAEFVAQNVDSNYAEIARVLEFEYSRRIVFVVYNTLSDFRQSNIGFSTSEEDYNVGGTTQIIDNKVVLYFSGDHADLIRQIRKGLAEVMISEFLYGVGSYRRILSNSALATYPPWFFDGLTEYFSQSWSSEKQDYIVQKIAGGSYRKFSQLYGDDAIVVGHAFWNFMSEQYGEKTISNVLYMSKLTGDIEASFQYVMGKSFQTVLAEMATFYSALKQDNPAGQEEQIVPIPKRLTKRVISDVELNSDGSKMVYVTNKQGKTGVWVYDFDSQKNQRIFAIGSVIEQITDYSNPVVQWHPTRNALLFFYEKKGKLWLAIYNAETEELVTREFHHFEKVLDFSFSQDGLTLIFSGVQGGVTDIFTYNIQTFESTQITNDKADDRYPSFVQNGNKILYVSNRADDNLQNQFVGLQSSYDLFLISGKSLERIATTLASEQKPMEAKSGTFVYLSTTENNSGLFAVQMDSTIRSVDTAFHYSYFTNDFQLKNTSQSIVNYAVADSTLLEVTTKNNRQFLQLKRLEKQDFAPIQLLQDTAVSQRLISHFDTLTYERENANLYKTNFYINSLGNQIDFSFLNTGYQAFTGGAYDYTQNLNVLLKLGIIDLFEDYRVTGAYRFTGSLGTNEYLVSVENLRKRLDRQYVFHRQSGLTYGVNSSRYFTRVQDNNFICRYKYPLDQIRSFSVNPNFRFVRNVTLATDMNSLQEPNNDEFWVGLSCNYVFDNVRKLDLNIYNGSRAKVFAEGFSQLTSSDSYLFVVGFDARHYQKIHRNLTLAARVAYSTSWGTSPLLYYLGAVDNWINLFGRYDTYNSSIQYDHSVDWAYQAIGTNMRGFSQNIRNGNSFAVANVELRWPIIQYLTLRPLKSEVLKHFQVIGFADFGGAWSGLIPGKKENAYNYTIINQEPIYVEIDEMRQPFVCGYGFGFRTRLFGYFVRFDIAWGYDEGYIQRMNQFSLGLDF